MTDQECINMYKTFIQPYFLYAIEVWGHTVQSPTDILAHLQSKVLRIILNCKRSDDAWKHNNGRILPIKELYQIVIKKLCLKHHLEILPSYFTNNNMPAVNTTQLQNRITRISLQQMYNYESINKSTHSFFSKNCYQLWNSLPLEVKSLPYSDRNCALRKFNAALLKLNYST